MSKTFEGKFGIKATIICDSISEAGVRLTTFEVEYPRIIHSELMTHRMFSRNAASSRAIPFNKMKEQLTARPVRFGKANPGMQDTGEDFDALVLWNNHPGCDMTVEAAWYCAKEDMLMWAESLYKAGYHKQVYNRLVEPFQMMKVLITATEFANFFWLRNDNAADPTLHELAGLMQQAYEKGTPKLLKPGHWHLPYVVTGEDYSSPVHGDIDVQIYCIEEGDCLKFITLEEAVKVSAARCAAVSYRNTDYTLEKCLQVYDRLVGDERKHSSAMEHQATPCLSYMPSTYGTNDPLYPETWENGISHADCNGQLWSGNFRGYIQHRKLIKGENHER